MSETMIERVGRVIMKVDGCGMTLGDRHLVFCDDPSIPEGIRAEGGCECKNTARKVIEAMREPTLEMLKASDNLILNDEEFHAGPYELTKAEWRAMIDAALKEPTP